MQAGSEIRHIKGLLSGFLLSDTVILAKQSLLSLLFFHSKILYIKVSATPLIIV